MAGSITPPRMGPVHGMEWDDLTLYATRVLDGEGEIDRRGFLKCMAWAGTGVLWTVGAGVPTSKTFGQSADRAKGSFSFAQISDSHIGFGKEPYSKTVKATLEETVARINALPQTPDFLIHTGDLTHLATAREFDTGSRRSSKWGEGRQDLLRPRRARHRREQRGVSPAVRPGDQGGGLVQLRSPRGTLHRPGQRRQPGARQGARHPRGSDQLDWLKADLRPTAGRQHADRGVRPRPALVAGLPPVGLGDRGRTSSSLGYLPKRFGSVTVLNGHIHQALQKIEGNMTFHTARSTGFPQPSPGAAPAPGPLKGVEAGKLRSLLGMTSVSYREGPGKLAVTDLSLG